MGHDAIAVRLRADVLADLPGAGQLIGGGTGQVGGLEAGLVKFPGAGANLAHV
jgi:hypothetical protein